ncbi:MAG: tetratricopeptide repeat protein [Rikenellaceae bacterium]
MSSIITEKQLAPDQAGLWLKAQQALSSKNYKYAISILKTVVKKNPGFLDGRKVLRACEVKSIPEGGRKTSFFGGMRLTSTRKNPELALSQVEDDLEKDPYSVSANELLFAAATDLNMPEVAAFALETICEGTANPKKHLHLLANHYIKNEQFAEAAATYTRVLAIDRADPVAMRGEKDCAARASMRQGNWEGKGDFRTKMKNSSETSSLESSDKVGLTRADMEARLAQLSEQYAADTTSLATVRDIASIYEQMEDYGNSYAFYSYAYELGGSSDISIKDKAMEIHEKALRAELAYYQQVLANDPGNADAQAALAAKQQEINLAIVTDARERCEANPTDAQLQYKLGEALFNAGEYTDAIPALQRARNNPNLRTKAMLMLGKCYASKSMIDMAIRQLEDANSELLSMDDLKKEILYMIGSLYAQSGNTEKSLENFKTIYEVDYGYKDVATRVESAYN